MKLSVDSSGMHILDTSRMEERMERLRDPVLMHQGADGWMLIASMSNRHIRNALRFYLRKMEAAKKVIEGRVTKFNAALYGIKQNPENAVDALQECNVKIAGFVYEAVIRGIDVLSERETLVRLLERADQLELPSMLASREYHAEVGEDYDPADDDCFDVHIGHELSVDSRDSD